MDATLYTGTGATQTITNAGGFSPYLVWLKKRGGGVSAQWHMLADTVRGTGATLSSNVVDAEYTGKTSVTAFNSNGFTLGADSTGASYYGWNIASDTYVGWQWDAGSSTVTNTNGTISSQVRANPTAGVSVVTYTGNGVSSATVGHGLGVAPKMVIHKCRSATGAWKVNHVGIPNQWIDLNLTDAASSGGGTNGSLGYQSTNTSATFQFTAGSSTVNNVNANGSTYVAYCFSEIAGFSKFSSYTGNGSSDGIFVYTGFRPKFVMTKRTDSATNANWAIHDTTRSTYNIAGKALFPNNANVEDNNEPGAQFDILSNGFKLRSSSDVYNGNGATYIYACFAENPFAQANAR
jgi:hypothetical protein